MLHCEIRYKSYGDSAILMQWPEMINEIILEEVLFCKKKIENSSIKLILEVVVSYNSLLVIYGSSIENFYDAVLELKTCVPELISSHDIKKKLWTIPVCYDSEVASDLECYCRFKELTKEQFIRVHSDRIYTVYFIGFLPGFLYLGGLDEQLFVSRKSKPSLHVPQGAVAIGGRQTGIYPQNSPGGWYVIGRSPLSFFDSKKRTPCFVSPGDKVKFESVSVVKYNEISFLEKEGVYVPENVIYEG